MKNKGFTLLELLVVIGIIGILMALATVAYTSAQSGGRNSRRKQDLVAIQNSLEQYYSAPGSNFAYPTGTCKVAATYLKSAWPTDPNTEADYAGVDACTSTSYCICATMEGAATSGNSGINCSWNADKTRYCVGNLQ